MSEPITIQAHPDLVLDLLDGGLRQIYFQGKPMLYSDLSRFGKVNPEYFGQFVAPFAGRIQNARLGEFIFTPNEGRNALHSANYCFCWKEYKRNISVNSREICVEFTREDTYFGAPCVAKARYILDRAKPKFRMELSFVCEKDVPCNLTTHCYFSLGEDDVTNVAMKMPAPRIMSYDKELIPLKYVPVEGRFDFRSPRRISFPMDHAYELDRGEVKAWTDKVIMNVKSTAKNVVIYVDVPSKQATGTSKGFTLEFVHFPFLGKEMILPAGTAHEVVNEYEFSSRG